MPHADAASRLPDEERSLVARAVAGDRGAARALYDAHAGRVYRVALRLAGDADLAADLTQDVFVRAFRELGKFRGESAFGTWLHRVAITTCLNGLRRVRRIRTREVALETVEEHPGAIRAIDPGLEAAVADAIDALPEPLRVALVMHTLEGFSHAEIGGVLGIAEGTSRSRVFEARARLRETLGPHLEDHR